MSEDNVLRLGIVGLGRRWEKRYKPALQRLGEQFHIAAVTDQIQQRASQEGKNLNCAVARGVAEMLRYPEIDALFLADAQWYGLWPVHLAGEFNKPVFCGSKARGENNLPPQICQNDAVKKNTVLVELPLRQSQLLAALREICRTQIGSVQLLRCNVNVPPRKKSSGAPDELIDAGYLDFCVQLLNARPSRFLVSGLPGGTVTNLIIEIADGKALQINECVAGEKRSFRLELFGETGTAVAEFPNRLRWRNKEGSWTRIIPVTKNPLLETLRTFHRAVSQSELPSPNLEEGCRLWHWQKLMLKSWMQGGWVENDLP